MNSIINKFDHRTVLLVGCGNMGYSMLTAWITRINNIKKSIWVVEPNPELRKRAAEIGVKVAENATQIHDHISYVIFATKPQIIPSILNEYRRFSDAVFISIAAGISIDTMKQELGDARIVRAMPNTPVSIGKGTVIVHCSDNVPESDSGAISNLMSACGNVHFVENEQMIDAATAISGSGPAYVFYFMECLKNAAIALGFPPRTALSLAVETVYGAASLAVFQNLDPSELRREVTSPNGTTAAALEILEGSDGLNQLMDRTVTAAFEKALSLSKHSN